jgi:long-chain acyl-CoA synthetase
VLACAAAGVPIVPQGGNTGLVGAAAPADGEVVLSTCRLNAVGVPDLATGTLEAGAGTTLERAQAVARAADNGARGALEQSLGAHLQQINATLDPHEQLDCLVVVTEPWTVDNGFITPTFKVKRNRIEEVYAKRFEGWIGARRAVVWSA